MADLISREEDLISGDEQYLEDLISGDEEDLISGDEQYLEDLMSGDEQYLEASSSMPVPAQTIGLISQQNLLSEQRRDLDKVMAILAVKEQRARTLLIYHRWDFQRLLDAYTERDVEWFFSQAGVANRPESTNSVVTRICAVCTDDDLEEGDTTMMDCGHTFCNVCWRKHFLTQIREGQSKRIKCMDTECNVICDEDIIRKLVAARDPEAAQRFDPFLFESYIDDNDRVKWCPSVPHCGNAVRVEGDVYCEIQCACGHQFCFNCLAQPHSPCSCLIWELWNKKCNDESESQKWIAVNTKSCPNLVTCLCGQYFCWLCGGATGATHTRTGIAGHSCGRYKEDQDMDIEKVERDLKRYTHYYSGWEAHKYSMKLEAKEREFGSNESGVTDYSWLLNAGQSLVRSRRVLAYSYVLAFHVFGDEILKDIVTPTEKEVKQNLFEYHQQQLEQQQLEQAVERLSVLIHHQNFMANRREAIDLTVLADTGCEQIYEWIQNDLLLHLGLTTHRIAPYNPKGIHILSDMM